MTFSLRNRIAVLYAAFAAAIFLAVFLLLYFVMHRTVYRHMDNDLLAEAQSVIHSVAFLNDRIIFRDEHEWQESEHRQAEVNPMFLQINRADGTIIRKSPNLESEELYFDRNQKERGYFNSVIGADAVRQLQFPLRSGSGRTVGFLLVAMPRQEAEIVLVNLRRVLIAAFPILLVVIFFSSRSIAKRSIRPVERITETAERITSQNLEERVDLPPNRDELFRLTSTIKELLDRIQNAFLREKQFTADASHEMRTPLAALKGTLEVLIRKRRSPEEYEEKIRYCISETERLADLVEHLLLLARCEAGQVVANLQPCDLRALAQSALNRIGPMMNSWQTTAVMPSGDAPKVYADRDLLEVMIQNLFSNAVKYSPEGSTIEIDWTDGAHPSFRIRDHGIGIPAEVRQHIFERFFRAAESDVSRTGGAGIGLAIVKRLADLQHLGLAVNNEEDGGTTFEILFNTGKN
jgi:heavy metal sensor kinase